MTKLLILILSLLSLTTFAQSINFKALGNGQFQVTGSGFNHSRTNSRQVNFYKENKYFKEIKMNQNGSFSYTSPMDTFKRGQFLTVKVIGYYGSGKHFVKKKEYRPGHHNGPKKIELTSLRNGQVRITGSGFTNSQTNSRQVNFYKNNRYFAEINMNSNGSFSYTSPSGTFSRGDSVTIKVIGYNGSGNHFVKQGTYRPAHNGGNKRVTVETLGRGQVLVKGSGFTNSQTNSRQVNFYKNNRYFAETNMNSNGSFSYTTPANTLRNGDTLTVKVIGYNGAGNHFVHSVQISGNGNGNGHGDDNFRRGCKLYTSTYALEALCLELRVPERVSKACKGTSTYGNEETCLRTRTRPATALACIRWMGTHSNENICLKTKNLDPAIIADCSKYTSTYSAEARCIMNAN